MVAVRSMVKEADNNEVYHKPKNSNYQGTFRFDFSGILEPIPRFKENDSGNDAENNAVKQGTHHLQTMVAESHLLGWMTFVSHRKGKRSDKNGTEVTNDVE